MADKNAKNELIGIHSIPEIEYHKDPCPEPSLSASITKIILTRSLYHAYLAHPKFCNIERSPTPEMEFGSAAHKLLLEGSQESIEIINAKDFRTSKAKEQRDEARNNDKIPMLQSDFDSLTNMVDAAKKYLKETELTAVYGDILKNGEAEKTMIAHDGCWLRGRIDFISNDRTLIIDYKTVSRSASPHDFARHVFNMGYDIQAAMYCYLNNLLGQTKKTTYVWLVQENTFPYCCSLVGASEHVLQNAMRKIHFAKSKWISALQNNRFDDYGKSITWASVPVYEEQNTERCVLDFANF